jgi:thioredoxin reductase
MKRTEVREIKDGKVRVKKDSKTGDEEVIFFDHLIVAHGYLPSDELYKKLKDRIEIYCIGDCNAPRRSIDAIHEAVKIATQI